VDAVATERYLVVGLARARTDWFAQVGQWTSASILPADFVKCVSAAEVRARISAAGSVSAVLLDAGAPGVDRDLIAAIHDTGAAPFVVEDGRAPRDWHALGVTVVLPRRFDSDLLAAHLRASAAPVVDRATRRTEAPSEPVSFVAPSVVVCGVPGTGASTIAMCVAQGLARRPDGRGSVLLADLARDGMLGAYHASPDVVPGVQEVVDAHRGGQPGAREVRAATFPVESRGYFLLQGLRRPRDWTALPPRATDAALASLRGAFRWVVADVTADLDGEAETGSVDVEERNHLARTSLSSATCVLAVGAPGVRGVRSLVRLLDALHDLGVDGDRVVAVVNSAPRSAPSRAAITRAVADLSSAPLSAATIHLPVRRGLERCHHTVEPLPAALVGPATSAVVATIDRVGVAPLVAVGPVPVAIDPMAS
jgi:hypothetical protein